MKIPLNFSQGIISVLSTVRIPDWRVYGIVKFLIDTGSPQSFIGEQDALRLQINFSRINLNERALLGGTSIAIGEITGDVSLYFKTEKESILIKPVKFFVSKDMRSKNIIPFNPSILGTDFLLGNNFTLYFNPSENIAYLERKD